MGNIINNIRIWFYNNNDDNECAICYEDIISSDICDNKFICNHNQFCNKCIDIWLKNPYNNCPICRAKPLNIDNYIPAGSVNFSRIDYNFNFNMDNYRPAGSVNLSRIDDELLNIEYNNDIYHFIIRNGFITLRNINNNNNINIPMINNRIDFDEITNVISQLTSVHESET